MNPKSFNDFVGNEKIVHHLKSLIKIIKEDPKNIKPIVFSGLPGTGKTTLVRLFARAIDFKLIEVIGGNVESSYLIPFFFIKEKGLKTIVFIDEIHALKPEFQESLFPIMSDRILKNIDLGTSTICGATTNIGKLLKPFSDRFVYNFEMSEYNENEIATIICKRFGISGKTSKKIAERSQNIPRIAINIATIAIDFCKAEKRKSLSDNDLNNTFDLLKVNRDGLSNKQQAVLYMLLKNGHCSQTFLANFLQTTKLEYETIVEPFLIKKEFIAISSKGRRLTDIGIEYASNL